MAVKRLFLLGAGASYSATRAALQDPAEYNSRNAPLDATFCRCIDDLYVKRPGWVRDAVYELTSSWSYHQEFSQHGLEAAIIRQLSTSDFVRSIHPKKKRGIVQATYVRNLAHVIAFILRRCRESSDEVYKKFAAQVFPAEQQAGSLENRVISFNYDDLLDKHLLKRFAPTEVYFDRLGETNQPKNKRSALFDHPLLVKLHGSVNWSCRANEFSTIVSPAANDAKPYFVEHIWLRSSGVPPPDSDEAPCIVPPLPNKPITKVELFRFLWTKAYEYLHEAQDLVIAGYSLPETDVMATCLFSNFTNTSLRTVTVVDPNPNIMSKWRALLNRAGIGKARWHYFADFRDYVVASAPQVVTPLPAVARWTAKDPTTR